MSKKPYIKPKVNSVKIEEPTAHACDIYNASGSAGSWTGSGVTNPTYHC